MTELHQARFKPTLPFKSVALTLLFTVILGPVGLLYATLLGGVVMIVLGFFIVCTKLMIPIILVWLISCIWGVAAANNYNKKILNL